MSSEENTLPAGCGYQGYEFGASYPDSACFGGQLYDMDNCDGDGMIYEPSEHLECPMCHPLAYTKRNAERWNYGGKLEYLWRFLQASCLTFDIWKNRILGTEPWKEK